jgi:5-formyltetrahydrofolate cyclo-ligase
MATKLKDLSSSQQHEHLRQSLRKTFRERRKTLSSQEQSQSAEQLVAQFQQHTLYNDAQKIALYLTHDGELNTQNLIQHLWKNNKAVYLPVLHPFSRGHLLFLRYQASTPMQHNRFHILEPVLDCSAVCPLRELDVLFTPLVAFDNNGNRLGMGGGFYDRTLARLNSEQSSSPKIVGLAHNIQKTENLPVEAWDIPLSYVQTPSRLYDFSAS